MSFITSVSLTYTWFDIQPLDPVLWTLVVEMKFYIFIALILVLKPKAFHGISNPIYSFALLHFVDRLLLQIFNYNFDSLMEGNSRFFIIGLICFYLRISIINRLIFPFCFWLIALCFYIYFSIDLSAFNFYALAMLFSILSIIVSRNFRISRRVSSISFALGAISYPLYLMHNLLGSLFFDYALAELHSKLMSIVTAVCITIVVCYITHLYLEKPTQSLTRKLLQLNKN
jgi:peptidoglycan/LPS O-acetylase OafA/YrhL